MDRSTSCTGLWHDAGLAQQQPTDHDPVRKKRCGVYYEFNGATYDGMDAKEVSRRGKKRVRAVANALARREDSLHAPQRAEAAARLLIKMEETGLVAKAAKQMHAKCKPCSSH